ncbi:diguanylate cyclase (GGDEF domain) with PAS/PAC sensor [Photobacterium marinum]|uniref:Thiamine pyrimidine synthase n=1 Tax=Photobacterium marinum TaxID=1056511 RepID=L8J8M1_9GAMM|nr:GGDEF domain-containing protein [Photobacterium marinum]ELR65156.1 diguanylate cyclase (GGDEF domain) with PAS/PAC sensor [Photobacterium marinum]
MKSLLSLFISMCLLALAAPSAATESVSIQLRWLHQAQFAGFYMAKEKGFYHDAGLDVTILPGGNNKVPIKEVLNGNADFGVGNTEVLVAYGRGFPVTALGAVFQLSPSILMANADSDIQTIHDLVGKRVMMFSGTEDAELILLLSRNHISLTDLEQITTSANINDLLSEKVDAFNGYLTNEPFFFEESGAKALIFNPADYGIRFYSDVIFTSQALAENRPETVDNFLNATIKGWYYALTHIEETLDVIEQKYHPQKSRANLEYELKTASKLIMPDVVDIGHMSQARWQLIADELAELNIIPQTTIDQNFLYPLRSKIAWQQLKVWILIGAILLTITSMAAAYFSYVNQMLKKEISRRKEAEQRAEEMARKDTLTGIANRYALVEKLHHTIANSTTRKPALLFIDLDNFKAVNDTYGHSIGDQVLQRFCARVSTLLDSETTFFARLAGDEFVILLYNSNKHETRRLAQSLSAYAGKPFFIDNNRIQIGASVGITFYRQNDTPDYFLSRADSKMYRNKKRSQKERFKNVSHVL